MTTLDQIELLRRLASGDIAVDDLTPNERTDLYRLQNESLARWYYSVDQDKGFWEITDEGRTAIESDLNDDWGYLFCGNLPHRGFYLDVDGQQVHVLGDPDAPEEDLEALREMVRAATQAIKDGKIGKRKAD